jgi:VanZ like family
MDDTRHRPTTGSRLAVALAVVAIGAATLIPQQPGAAPVPWYLPFGNPGDGADALLNILLFIPLGVALGLARQPRDRTVRIALLTTVTVELLQGLVIPGRQASIGDVLTNTAGGWLGHAMVPALTAAWRADRRLATRLATGWAATWLVLTVTTAALLRPALPVGQVEPARCGLGRGTADCFPGRLTRPIRLRQPGLEDVAVVPGLRVPIGREASIVAELVDGGRTFRPARVGGVATRPGGALMTLEQGDHWLVFGMRTRGASWGLRTPAVVIPGVFGRPGNRVEAEGGTTGNVRWLQAGARRVELRLSGAEGWRLFLPWSALDPGIIRAVGALFHAIALLPLAFWLGRALGPDLRGRAAATAAVLGVVAIAFGGGSMMLDLDPVAMTDWLGAVSGSVGGALLAGRVRD